MEYTLVIIKPDAVMRGLVGEFTSRFERKGLQLIDIKMIMATETELRAHYVDLITKPYFDNIIKSMTMGRLVVQLWYGVNAINIVRQMIGSTDPQDSLPGTIRGDYAINIGRNVIHASDSLDSAERECIIWFGYTECKIPEINHLIYRID